MWVGMAPCIVLLVRRCREPFLVSHGSPSLYYLYHTQIAVYFKRRNTPMSVQHYIINDKKAGIPPQLKGDAALPLTYKMNIPAAWKEKGYNTNTLHKKASAEGVIQSLREGRPISWANIAKVCEWLNCQPGDTLQYNWESFLATPRVGCAEASLLYRGPVEKSGVYQRQSMRSIPESIKF